MKFAGCSLSLVLVNSFDLISWMIAWMLSQTGTGRPLCWQSTWWIVSKIREVRKGQLCKRVCSLDSEALARWRINQRQIAYLIGAQPVLQSYDDFWCFGTFSLETTQRMPKNIGSCRKGRREEENRKGRTPPPPKRVIEQLNLGQTQIRWVIWPSSRKHEGCSTDDSPGSQTGIHMACKQKSPVRHITLPGRRPQEQRKCVF